MPKKKFNSIRMFYWHSMFPISGFEDIPHKAEFPYTLKKRNELISRCLDAGHPVMLKEYVDGQLTVCTTRHRDFSQR
jgi:hypothetical protein